MPTLFTQIIERKIPAHIVAEDAQHIAFLDICPIVAGHTLVVPKQEVAYLFDLSPQALGGLMCFAQKVGAALEKAVPCKRIALLVLGLEVPHVHVHLLPIQQEQDLRLGTKKVRASEDALYDIAKQVRTAYIP